MKHFLLLLLLGLALILPGSDSFSAQKNATNDPSKESKTEKIDDPEFNQYIGSDDLDQAMKSNNVETLLLAAQKLAKGEKELGRPNKITSSEMLLLTAYQIASSQESREIKMQIRKVARSIGKLSIIPEFNTIDKIRKRSSSKMNHQEKTTPLFTTAGNKETEALVDSIVQGAQSAVARKDRAAIEDLEKQVQDKLDLSDQLRLELINYLAEMKAQTTSERTLYKEDHRFTESSYNTYPQYWPDHIGLTYFGRSLRATFSMEPGGARILYLYPYSPLRGRLRTGDLITHLDYMLVNDPAELEQHYSWTLVDFYSNGRYGRISIFIPIMGYFDPIPHPIPGPIPHPMPGPIPRPDPMPDPVPDPIDLPSKYRGDGHQLHYTPGVNKNFNPVPEENK